jgi:hypothetical protein
MKLVKIIGAGIVGGILIFVWGFVSHEILKNDGGLRQLPPVAEDAVLAAMRANITEPGIYTVPGMPHDQMANAPVMATFEAKYMAGASGMLVIAPIGEPAMTNLPLRIAKELAADIAAGILGALLVFWGVAWSGIFRTIGMSIAMGLMSFFLLTVSYNIWYRFPRTYVIQEGMTEVIGFAIAGVGFYIVSLFFRKKIKHDPDRDRVHDTVI